MEENNQPIPVKKLDQSINTEISYSCKIKLPYLNDSYKNLNEVQKTKSHKYFTIDKDNKFSTVSFDKGFEILDEMKTDQLTKYFEVCDLISDDDENDRTFEFRYRRYLKNKHLNRKTLNIKPESKFDLTLDLEHSNDEKWTIMYKYKLIKALNSKFNLIQLHNQNRTHK